MRQKLIIIRGNSGSGKSTIAKKLREKLSVQTMFLQQDVLRRDILRVEDKIGNPAVKLIAQMALYGKDNEYDVLLEGILAKVKYGEMLEELISQFGNAHIYYLDVPFKETLARHKTRPEFDHFGETEMREWWREKDYLGVKNEKLMSHSLGVDEIVNQILDDIKNPP